MADERKPMTVHEVSALRGKFKAKKRAVGMAKRYRTAKDVAEQKYQEQLAKDLQNNL